MKQHRLCLTTPLITLVTLALISGCGSLNKKKSAGKDGPQPIPTNSFAQKWMNDLRLGKKDGIDRLFLRDDLLFVYTKANIVYCLGSSGGELRYTSEPDVSGGVLRRPLVMGNRVIYPCGSSIEIFNDRGRPIRTVELEKPTSSAAVGSGNTIYIGLDHPGGAGVVASIDLTKTYRVVNWELLTFGAVDGEPALYDKIIFAGSEDGRIYAMSEERGQVWPLKNAAGTFDTQGKFVSDIVADEYGVYAANTDSVLYCLDRVTGKIKWRYYGTVPLRTAPVVTATMVYQYADGVGLAGIDKANGTFNRSAKWIIKDAVQMLAEDKTLVYLRTADNRIIAVDKSSGQIVFGSKKQPFEVFTTNLKDNTIYAAAKDGRIWGIRPVLKEGEVGTLVMGAEVDFRSEPLAMAR